MDLLKKMQMVIKFDLYLKFNFISYLKKDKVYILNFISKHMR